MLSLEQLQQDFLSLPEEAQTLLLDFVEILKKRYSQTPSSSSDSTTSTYQQFKNSGFIGQVSLEEDLSNNYKQVLSEKWSKKYDHR